MRSSSRSWLIFLAAIIACAATSCGRIPPRPNSQQTLDILSRGKPFAENSFWACFLSYYQQGLPIKQIQELCEAKLSLDDKKGFGEKAAGLPPSFTATN